MGVDWRDRKHRGSDVRNRLNTQATRNQCVFAFDNEPTDACRNDHHRVKLRKSTLISRLPSAGERCRERTSICSSCADRFCEHDRLPPAQGIEPMRYESDIRRSTVMQAGFRSLSLSHHHLFTPAVFPQFSCQRTTTMIDQKILDQNRLVTANKRNRYRDSHFLG